MTFKERLALWYIRRKLVAVYKKGLKMNPLPKWVGWLANLGAVGSLLSALGGALPPKYAAICATLATLINSVTHSLPGTGGKPQ